MRVSAYTSANLARGVHTLALDFGPAIGGGAVGMCHNGVPWRAGVPMSGVVANSQSLQLQWHDCPRFIVV